MALYKYFKKETDCNSAFITTGEIEKAGEKVKQVLDASDRNSCSGKLTPRCKYNAYTAEQQAQIGRYAAENGNTKAAKHFSVVLGTKINESTARRLKTEYLQKLQNLAAVGVENVQPTVKTLPLKTQGRPLLLGVELDQAVQEYITSLRAIGGVVNTAIVIAAAEGIVSTRDASKLTSHGGHIEITSTWAKSLLSRMGYVKRKCSNAGKVPTPLFNEIKNVFLADVTAEVIMNDIPDDLIINWDQTALQFVPTGQWAMHQSGEKVVPISHSDDKRQITAVLAATMKGEYLPPQLIYKGKTSRCHPKVDFTEWWDIWHSENHWSNEETMHCYIEKIIVPFIEKKRIALKLPTTHPALVLYDCFRGQTTAEIESLLEKNNIVTVQISANCTDKLQPMDVSVNRPMKDRLRKNFQTWYAGEVQKQLKTVSVDQVKVDITAAAIKPLCARWIQTAWQGLEQQPQIAINGFRKAGIFNSIADARQC